MKRIITLLCSLLAAVCLFSVPANALEYDETLQELYDESGITEAVEVLDEQTLSLLYSLGIQPQKVQTLIDTDISGLPKEIWDLICEQIKQPMQLLTVLIALLLFAVLLQGVSAQQNAVTTDLFILIVSAGALGQPILSLIRQLNAVFETTGSFMELFMPAYAGIAAAAGQSTAAYGMQALTFGASVVITELMTQIMLPVLSVYMALCFVCSANELLQTDVITKSIAQAVGWVLGIAMSLFTIILGVQRMITQTADTLGMKTAKLAVSTLVPVVGSQLSDVLSSVTACFKLLNSSVGSFAVIAITVIFLPAVISMLSMLLVLKIAEIAAALFRVEAAKRMYSALSGGIGILLGITLCGASLLIIALTLLASAVS